VELSVSQKKSNGVFQQAVAHAQAIIRDPERKEELKKKLKSRKKTANQAPYHAAIQEYMRAHSPKTRMAAVEEILSGYMLTFPVTDRQVEGLKFLALEEKLSNAVYQNINKVSKATATRDLQDLVSRGIIEGPVGVPGQSTPCCL
jgi:Fic family protein